MLTPEACKSFFFLMQILNSITGFFFFNQGIINLFISNNSNIYNLSTWQATTDGQKETDGRAQGNSKMFTIKHNKQLPQVDDHHQISLQLLLACCKSKGPLKSQSLLYLF